MSEITDYILPETFCHSQQIFKWMRNNAGYKHFHWNSKITVTKINGSRQMQFTIYDEGMRALFKLTFAEHFTKMDVTQYLNVFHIHYHERMHILAQHSQ